MQTLYPCDLGLARGFLKLGIIRWGRQLRLTGEWSLLFMNHCHLQSQGAPSFLQQSPSSTIFFSMPGTLECICLMLLKQQPKAGWKTGCMFVKQRKIIFKENEWRILCLFVVLPLCFIHLIITTEHTDSHSTFILQLFLVLLILKEPF